MKLFHEVPKHTVTSILEQGLKRTSRGEKGNDDAIIKTDILLDQYRPTRIKQADVSRDNNIYAYIGYEDTIIDITNGREIALAQYINASSNVLFKLNIDDDKCYVSDLELYDSIKNGVANGKTTKELLDTIEQYWNTLLPLNAFHLGRIRRPEVMITYDIPPERLQIVTMK